MAIHISRKELNWSPKLNSPILAVGIAPGGNQALSSGLDFVLRQWDLRSGGCTHSWDAGGPLNAVTIHPNGKWALVSTVMGALLWDLRHWQFIRSYRTNYGGTDDIAYSEELGMVVGAGDDSLVYRWDIESGERHSPLAAHRYPVSALDVSDEANLLTSGDSSGEIRLWALSSGDPLAAWQGHDSRISDLAILPRSRQLVSAAHGPLVKVWDLDSGEHLQEMSAGKGWVNTLAVSKHEEWMLSAGDDGLRIMDLKDYQCVHSDDSVDISCLALSADGQMAISGSRDGSLSTWSIQPSVQETGEP
jgi:WD40 repeat protein